MESAPALPAKTLEKRCYLNMFKGCTKLKAVTCLATDGFDAEDCLEHWLTNTAEGGNGILTIDSRAREKWIQQSATNWNYPSNWNIQELTTGTAKAKLDGTNDVDVTWVQLWENGPKFATINVGVTSTSATGINLYGGLYRWGGTNNMRSNTSASDDHNTGSADLTHTGDDPTDTATNLWGSNWRMPTQTELQGLIDNCTWSTFSSGYTITGKDAYTSNSIFLPAAGYFTYSKGNVSSVGSRGDYWSSTKSSSNNAYYLDSYSDSQDVDSYNCKDGYSVRPVLKEAE